LTSVGYDGWFGCARRLCLNCLGCLDRPVALVELHR
jgi:hypothetical protein